MKKHFRNIGYCLFIAIVVGLSLQPALAQQKTLTLRDSLFCGAPILSPADRQALESRINLALAVKKASGDTKAGPTYVPIRPHIFRTAGGTGGMSLNSLNNVLAINNKFFHDNGSGIQFYFCGTTPDYIDNDTLYTAFPYGDESSVAGRDAPNAMNVYFVNYFNQRGLLGYAYFPANALQSTRSFIRTGGLSDTYTGSYVLNHELGHNFSLYHTFQGNTENYAPELVTRGPGANCSTTADLLCDTPADPYGRTGATTSRVTGCEVYTGTITDPNGELYRPQMGNIMSYYDGCNPLFTPGQYGRIQGGLATRQSATAYSLDCAPTVVAAVSNLSAAAAFTGGIKLTWQDNATNEMGYFIERATSTTGVFAPVGGVGPNSTSFTDVSTESFTGYTYRIRPSNSTTAGISTVVSATAGGTFCRPTFSQGCYDEDGLDSFTVNGAVLSQNTGCTLDGYTQYPVISATLTAGVSTTVGGRFLGTRFREGVTIWGDLNRNSVYDSTEILYQTPVPLTSGFSGSLTIPASTSAGPLNIRVIVQYDARPANPCGNYSFGEGEDYVVQVDVPCTALFTTRAGSWNDPAIWSCGRVPTAIDPVEVRHAVAISGSVPASARRVSYAPGGSLRFETGARLRLGP